MKRWRIGKYGSRDIFNSLFGFNGLGLFAGYLWFILVFWLGFMVFCGSILVYLGLCLYGKAGE